MINLHIFVSRQIKQKTMARKFSFIKLKDSEVQELDNLLTKGTHPVREIRRARILLLNHQGYTSSEVTKIVGCSPLTFYNIVNKYKDRGLDNAIKDKPRSGRPPVYSGVERAKITALACTDAPEGYVKWTVRLLADKAVELNHVNNGAIGYATIHRILKKTT